MSSPSQSFTKLQDHLKRTAKFGYAASLLAWDQRSYMPSGGSAGRAEIIATVETEYFKNFISQETGDLLGQLAGSNHLDPAQRLLVNRVESMYQRQKKIPPDFYERLSLHRSKSQNIWVEAKQTNNFALFAPALKEMYSLVRQLCDIYGYAENPYDALLPDYEPGLTAKELTRIISELSELKTIVKTLAEKNIANKEGMLQGHFPQREQSQLCHQALSAVGYDLNHGRLDRSEHPFSITVGPRDVRLTTNFKPWTWTYSFFASLHEAGHGMYDQGRDESLQWFYQDSGFSLGMHESQSRMWENLVGRSLSFWKFFYPSLQRIFPYYGQIALPDFYRAINLVKPSPVRTEADEVTYNLHIMLRFEVEESLLRKKLEVEDLPAFWNQKMKEYLGITPASDSQGVLQDIHWSGGMIGYFPTYMLGNLYSAQLFATAKRDIPNLEQEFAKGNFQPLLSWLREKIHRFGLLEEAPSLIKRVTGSAPSPVSWLSYIKQKFGEVYQVKL